MFSAKTFQAEVYISSPFRELTSVIQGTVREFCKYHKVCVSIDETSFIHDTGSELGHKIRFIQYPKNIRKETDIKKLAIDLGYELLKKEVCKTCTVVCTDDTFFLVKPVKMESHLCKN